MEILIGQHLDDGYFLDQLKSENRNIFNKEIVGPLGFLGILEREFGTSGKYYSYAERKALFNGIINKFMEKYPEMPFSESYQNDPGGVTGELLKYRDQLILSGWNKDFGPVSSKIDCLTKIEKSSEVPFGTEDRWRKVLDHLINEDSVDFRIKKIILIESLDDMHPFFRQLFEVLEGVGVIIDKAPINPVSDQKTNLDKVKKLVSGGSVRCELMKNSTRDFQIIRFRDDIEAADFFSTQDQLLERSVIINSSPNNFDEIRGTFGKPASGSKFSSANPPVIQLFKLATSLFIKPLNIHNLLSYLQIPVHPVPLALRIKLMKVITELGGVENEEWNSTIKNYEFEDEKRKKIILTFLEIQRNEENRVEKKDIQLFYNSLNDWARIRKESKDIKDAAYIPHLHHLRNLCDTLNITLGLNSGSVLTNNELLEAVKDIYEPMNIKNFSAQRNSVPLVSVPGQLISDADTIIWMDFYNSEIKPDLYSFLNKTETEALIKGGALLWDAGSQAQAQMNMLRKGILKADTRCVLAICNKVTDEPTDEHPLHSLLKAGIKDLNEHIIDFEEIRIYGTYETYGFKTPEFVIVKRSELPTKHSELIIKNGPLICNRETESYSSIEKLIQYPFDWVMDYAGQVSPSNTFALGDIPLTCGNVAHRYIEILFKSSEFALLKAKESLKNYEKDILRITESYGVLLLLPENRFDFEQFKTRLYDSVNNLIKIIEMNDLKILGLEYPVKGSAGILNDQYFEGYVDLLLEDRYGNRVIFDMKWTRSDKKYKEKIRKGKSVQLGLYRALTEQTEQKKVSITAYYLLSTGSLITDSLLKGSDFTPIEADCNHNDVMKKIENSVNFRREQLQAGIIEEGEEGSLEELSYYQTSQNQDLINLDTDSTGKLKKKNYYSSYGVLKGDIN